MAGNSKPRKAKATKQVSRVLWDELKEPIETTRIALTALEYKIRSACQPGVFLLTASDKEDFQNLKTSTCSDITELKAHLEDVAKHIEPLYGKPVSDSDLMRQYNYGNTLFTILTQASGILAPDVDRLADLRLKGEANQTQRQSTEAVKPA